MGAPDTGTPKGGWVLKRGGCAENQSLTDSFKNWEGPRDLLEINNEEPLSDSGQSHQSATVIIQNFILPMALHVDKNPCLHTVILYED